jgi:hypothetical protein
MYDSRPSTLLRTPTPSVRGFNSSTAMPPPPTSRQLASASKSDVSRATQLPILRMTVRSSWTPDRHDQRGHDIGLGRDGSTLHSLRDVFPFSFVLGVCSGFSQDVCTRVWRLFVPAFNEGLILSHNVCSISMIRRRRNNQQHCTTSSSDLSENASITRYRRHCAIFSC